MYLGLIYDDHLKLNVYISKLENNMNKLFQTLKNILSNNLQLVLIYFILINFNFKIYIPYKSILLKKYK